MHDVGEGERVGIVTHAQSRQEGGSVTWKNVRDTMAYFREDGKKLRDVVLYYS